MSEVLGVLGPGVLGLSLAQWATERGVPVRLYGRDLNHARRALDDLGRRWGVLVRKGRIPEGAREAYLGRIEAGALGDWRDCTALLEALPEDPELKARLWGTLAAGLPQELLCLTGSSALPVGPMARSAGLGGRLLGFHLFVPVRNMRVVELVAPSDTGEPWTARATALGLALGLRVIAVRDGAGYAAARMSLALGLEAMRLVEEGVATSAELDALMRLGYGHPLGPLELSDRVGLDLRFAIATRLEAAYGDRFKAPEILRNLVTRQCLGRRTGRGFLDWTHGDEA